ncbi:hypothetical protein R3P38DRAFT_3307706 [Favolaschia claudopus]|uniref:Uncharacterized protein n=1 Tax=Favolaschia claudopus TaxID=2862362 RepID=A0AAW0D746_9AGAR
MGANLSTELVPSWQQTCANSFNCSSSGLVDINGQSVSCRPNITNVTMDSNVWGITYSACQEKCGMDKIRQLPFEAVGWRNLLSACTCLGSPALAAYSLALTASNRVYIDKKFKTLKAELRGEEGSLVAKRLDAIAFILKEAQQCPLRANQRHGEFAALLLLNDSERDNFWKGARKDLKNTRRDFTYSFGAQVFLAFITYLFSFVAAVHDSLGSPDVGLQFASSTVWSWMYICVGCQDKSGTIREALERHLSGSGNDYSPHQTALRPSGDFTGGSGDDQTVLLRNMSMDIDCPLSPVTFCGFDVRGEAIHEGPVFNYARVLTWFALTRHIEKSLATAIRKFRRGDALPTTEIEAAEICGFQPACQDLAAYIPWSDIPPFFIKQFIFAAVLAIILQWGSTGAAIFVAYNTPMVGIGCRSGSYIIYGIAATVSWLLLVASNFYSHAVMQRLEKQPTRNVGLLGALAVITRILGNTLVVLNAGWLIASTILEEIGFFQTCWCQTDSFQLGTSGWTPVFKASSDLRSVAGGVWIGGFIWSAVISVFTSGIFASGPKPE